MITLIHLLLLFLFLFKITKSESRRWYAHQFISTSVLYIELRGLLDHYTNSAQITNELDIELKEEAKACYTCLHVLNWVRLSLTAILYYHGMKHVHTKVASPSHDCCASSSSSCTSPCSCAYSLGWSLPLMGDCVMIELYLYVSYIYRFHLPVVFLISLVSYFYYKFVRF